jgi:hypothetical protein
MTETTTPDAAERRSPGLRRLLYAAVAVQAALWIYLFVYIAQHANPKGDGMEWVGVMPGTMVFALGALPAWSLRRSKRALPLGVALAVEPQDVILGQTESADGCFIIDACVWSVPIVAV